MHAQETACTRRVLLVADDRRFRALAATLLSRRGYRVSVSARDTDLVAAVRREAIDVVVLDASTSLTAAARDAARVNALCPAVGIVAVSADSQSSLAALPVVPKWSPVDALFQAIERACPGAAQDEVSSVAS